MMLNRLLVLLQIIFIPLYFIYFSTIWQEEILFFFDILLSRAVWLRIAFPSWMVGFLTTAGIPLLFSLPWVIPSIIKATRIADAYSLMGRALGKVRIDQKLFYGINAAFTLIFFILPFGSPLITVIGIFYLVRMGMRKILIGKISKIFWIIPALILAFYPVLIATAFYLNYVDLIVQVLATWNTYIGTVFGIGLSLAISISFGNFLLFLLEGRAKYEKVEVNEGLVIIIKGALLGILLLLYFNDGQSIVDGANYLAVGLAFFEMFMRRRHDLNTDKNSGRGIIMVIIFSLVNILLVYLNEGASILQSLVIIISGLIFFVLFWMSYKYAEDPELIDF